jgi:hypothetical protein
MPITGPTSFLSTSDEFLTHWGIANGLLGAGNEILLKGTITLAMLQSKKDALVTKRSSLASKLNLVELARADLEDRKLTLLAWGGKFNDRVRALYSGSKWERSLPVLPTINDGLGPFSEPMDDIVTLWELLNADATLPDLILVGGITQAQFATELTAFRAAFSAHKGAIKVANFTLEERNDIQDELQPIFKEYRKAVPGYFEKNAAILDSLPDLTPPPGSTPQPVVANGTYDATIEMARLSSTVSTDPNLLKIEWRYCSGPNYSTDLEAAVPGGTVLPGGNHEILTNIALPNPGSVATFRAYVITTLGHEKGSNTVTIIRPEAPTPP